MSAIEALLSGPDRVVCGPLRANISLTQCAFNQARGRLDPYGMCNPCRRCDNPGRAPQPLTERFVPRANNGMCYHTRASRDAQAQGEPLLRQKARPHLSPPRAAPPPPKPPPPPPPAQAGAAGLPDDFPGLPWPKQVQALRDASARRRLSRRRIDEFLGRVNLGSRAVRVQALTEWRQWLEETI
jgi:hypothetical protein